MNLTVFQSEDGDCMVLTGADGKMVLADGGRKRAYSAHAAHFLAAQFAAGKKLETVYISHIDADHIEGILQMLDDLVAFKVLAFQQRQRNTTFQIKTRNKQPMQPKNIWHNSFSEMAQDNKGEIAEILAAAATVLSGSDLKEHLEIAARHQDLATSMTQAADISRRIGQNQLKINLNPQFGGKLMLLKDKGPVPPPIKIGKMNWHLLGPFERDLRKLRTEWDDWLKSVKGKKAIENVKRRAAEDEKDLGNSATEVSRLIGPGLAGGKPFGRYISAGRKRGGPEWRNDTKPGFADVSGRGKKWKCHAARFDDRRRALERYHRRAGKAEKIRRRREFARGRAEGSASRRKGKCAGDRTPGH